MKIKLLLALLICQIGFAQQRTCGMEQKMQSIMANPILKKQYLEQQARFEVELEKLQQRSLNRSASNVTTTIRIPVAVHFPSSGSASAAIKTCLRSLAQSQVNILNADYNATNSDISLWAGASSFYPGTNIGSLNVEFVLATINHPSGTGLVNGDLAVTFGTDFLSGADYDATWSGYMNLVCRNIGGSTLGYSPLGGFPGSGETVVIRNSAFGSGAGCTGYVPTAPFNLGRTLTHELGHFFNLDHTFAGCDDANCATSGDLVCDTPSVENETYNCPADGSVNGCVSGQKSLTMNYMDYVNDSCMYMFTEGQATRMLAYYNSIASQFSSNVLSNNGFLESSFSIYPNPNKGSFNIQFKNLSDGYEIEVFDVSGRNIYNNFYNSTSNPTQSITLDNTSAGVYFINIKSNNSIVTKKMLIE